MTRLLVLLVVGALLISCSSARRPVAQARTHGTLVPPVVSVAPSTSATPAPPPARASRGRTPGTLQRPPVSAVPGASGDFWRRLADCESADGRSGTFLGYFQFSRDTARKVGWFDPKPTPPADRAWTYEEQRSMAIRWLGMIGGRGGSRSGWPVCWWRAGGGGGGSW